MRLIGSLFFTAVLFSLLFNPGTALAQNRYFLHDTHGVTLTAGLARSEGATGYGGVATLTLFGRLDLGLGYLAAERKSGLGYLVYKWEEITPAVGFALVQPKDGGTWGLDLTANTSSVKFGGRHRNTIGGDSLAAGLDLYFYMRESRDLIIMPRFGVSYMSVNAWRKENDGVLGYDVTVDSVSLGFEWAFLMKRKYIIAPAITRFDGIVTWSIMAGIAMPQDW